MHLPRAGAAAAAVTEARRQEGTPEAAKHSKTGRQSASGRHGRGGGHARVEVTGLLQAGADNEVVCDAAVVGAVLVAVRQRGGAHALLQAGGRLGGQAVTLTGEKQVEGRQGMPAAPRRQCCPPSISNKPPPASPA